MAGKVEVYERVDGKWAWRIKAGNGEIVATDGGQGYDDEDAAARGARAVASGAYGSQVEDDDA